MGVLQAAVVLLRKLGIDGQPDLVLIVPAGKPDGELDECRRPGNRLNVFLVLGWREDVFQEGLQLDLAPGAPGLHDGQDPYEVTDVLGELLHIA